ncbi:hypothetical protein RDV89_12685 [Nocardioides zeae]|uniref:Integral membrane protein n=1 Tax=Nocardioides imazamoxiresistens TaxID=3231893 RepID=A0ABU3PXH5_9ACTN|nr:hypothetical protein [Nocardioides zeae]MDT9593930.1 hypothetical protein [Nocardioides zeae]
MDEQRGAGPGRTADVVVAVLLLVGLGFGAAMMFLVGTMGAAGLSGTACGDGGPRGCQSMVNAVWFLSAGGPAVGVVLGAVLAGVRRSRGGSATVGALVGVGVAVACVVAAVVLAGVVD